MSFDYSTGQHWWCDGMLFTTWRRQESGLVIVHSDDRLSVISFPPQGLVDPLLGWQVLTLLYKLPSVNLDLVRCAVTALSENDITYLSPVQQRMPGLSLGVISFCSLTEDANRLPCDLVREAGRSSPPADELEDVLVTLLANDVMVDWSALERQFGEGVAPFVRLMSLRRIFLNPPQ